MPRLHPSRRFQPQVSDVLEHRSMLSALTPGVGHHREMVGVRSLKSSSGFSFPNQVYSHRQGRSFALDLTLPQGVAPPGGWPVVIAFPGAGWRSVDRRLLAGPLASFPTSGYALAVVDVAYASDQPGSRIWPTNFETARDAVRWVRSHASRYGVDPDKIVAFGESSGAHLALLLGSYPSGDAALNQRGSPSSTSTSQADAGVQAVVDLYGPVDLAPLYRQPKARDKLLTFLGGSPSRFPGRYVASSPLTYISARSAPTFIAHGTEDTTIPQGQSIALSQALNAAEVANRLVLLPGYGHGFQPEQGRLNLIPQIVAFLDEVLTTPFTGSNPSGS